MLVVFDVLLVAVVVMTIVVMAVVIVVAALHALGKFLTQGVHVVHHTDHRADVLSGSGQNVLYPFLAFAAVAEKHVRLRDADHIQRRRLEAVGLPPGGHQQIRLHPVAADGPDKIIVRKQGANHPQSAVVLPCRGSGAAAQQQRRRQQQTQRPATISFHGNPPFVCL